MKSALQVESEFKEDIKTLLAKYGAEVELIDKGRDWSYDYVIQVTIPARYDDHQNVISDFSQFSLGSWINENNA
jgi:hypothetical protein